MERSHVHPDEIMGGYDALQLSRSINVTDSIGNIALRPSDSYREYHNMHKVFVGESTVPKLVAIGQDLEREFLPDALDTAAWSFLEAGLVSNSRSRDERIQWVDRAICLWTEALRNQELINQSEEHEWYREDSSTYRLALSIAFEPLFKAIVQGDVTSESREKVFRDILAIAQHAEVQRHLASKSGDVEALGDMLGFEHEVNAMLAILHMDDPRYVCVPSSARAGSGTTHPEQTHDIVVINQHWGKILDAAPVEVKAHASLNDIRRYKALIVRGKMHMAMPGRYSPEHTRNAFAAYYEGIDTKIQAQTVYQVKSNLKELLRLYRGGAKDATSSSITRYRDKKMLMIAHPELSYSR